MLSSKALGPALGWHEGVAYAPHGAYVRRLPLPVELLPQVRDVVLDHARRDLARNPPHGVEQHGARENPPRALHEGRQERELDRKSTRLNSSHANISYAVFCL